MRFYVSPEHRDAPASGCSLATLAVDAARSTDPADRATSDEILQAVVGDLLTRHAG